MHKPLTEFSKNASRPDGRCERCKSCDKLKYDATRARWAAENKARREMRRCAPQSHPSIDANVTGVRWEPENFESDCGAF